ncbi:MAG: hypothetical protein VX527_03855 [Planctomycetota bacterium]|nr:hypothetical protein [Planctomycetota bacterium]
MRSAPHCNRAGTRCVHRRGVALLLVLVTMGTATTLTLGWLASQDNAAPVSQNVSRTAQARAAASSGLELAVAIMQTDTSWRTAHTQGLLLANHPIGQGVVDIQLIDVATDLPPVEGADTIHVLVTARVENLTQQVQAIASVVNTDEPDGNDLSGFAVWVHSGMRLQGQSSVRRWHDAPMASMGRRLFIGTDAVTPRSIDIGSQVTAADWTIVHDEEASHALVRNDSNLLVRIQPAIQVFGPLKSSATLNAITGQKRTSDWFNPTRDDWSQHPSELRMGSGSTVNLPEGANLALDSLELESGTTLRISGETTLTVHDDLRIDNARITLAPDANLTLICGGEVTMRDAYVGDDGGDVLDLNGRPSWYDASHVNITCVGDLGDTPPWQISGTSLIKAVIEAPDARLIIRDDSILAGRLAVDYLKARHNATVLYDHGLDSGAGATKLTSEDDDSRSRINRKLAKRFTLWAEDLGLLDTKISTSTDTIETSRYGLAADDAWWNQPSDREIPVDVQMLVHGGDTQRWETSATVLQTESSP